MVFRWVQSLNLIHTDNHKYEQKCACAQSHWMHNIVVYMHVHSTNCFSQGHWFGPIYVYMHVSVNFELEIRRDIILCETHLKAYTETSSASSSAQKRSRLNEAAKTACDLLDTKKSF